jgi:hypothetical protein
VDMSDQVQNQTDKTERPHYETPRIQAMSEKDILSSFQITQSMGSWWAVPTC